MDRMILELVVRPGVVISVYPILFGQARVSIGDGHTSFDRTF